RVPQRAHSLTSSFFHIMELRSARVIGVATILFVLVGVGRWLTNPDYLLGGEELAVSAGPPAGSFAELRQRLVASEIPMDPRYRDMLSRARVPIPPAFVEDVSSAPSQAARPEGKKDET